MSALHVICIVWFSGVPAFMWWLAREIARGARAGAPNVYLLTSRRNVAILIFAFALVWPLLLATYFVVRPVLRAFWKNEPPDDPDDPEEQPE